MFQHTATRRWLQVIGLTATPYRMFQHTATRRWLHTFIVLADRFTPKFQHTATRRWLQYLS